MSKIICFLIVLFFASYVIKGQIIYPYAGQGSGGGTDGIGDGLSCEDAIFEDPTHMTFDAIGNLYVVEATGHRLRKIDTFNIITLVAGNGSITYNGDSILATAASINVPGGIATDTNRNIYIAESDHRLRKIDSAGFITTIAGTGTSGFSGDNGLAKFAMISYPNDICIGKDGTIYFTDAGNDRIRKINTMGIITTIAGNGLMGNDGDDGLAVNASLESLRSIIVDDTGSVFFSEWGTGAERIRKIDTFGYIHLIAGNGNGIYNGDSIIALQAGFDPVQIAFDNEKNIVIADNYNKRVRIITNNNHIINNVAGNGQNADIGDGGLALEASFTSLGGVAVDKLGNIFVSQVDNPRIRKIVDTAHHTTGVVTPMTASSNFVLSPNPAINEITIQATTLINDVVITNLIGQVVYHQTCNTKKVEVNIAPLPKGVYFVKVNGQYVQKLLKE